MQLRQKLTTDAFQPTAVQGARRASWRIVSSIESKEEVRLALASIGRDFSLQFPADSHSQSKGNSTSLPHIKEYRQKIEQELAKICKDILQVLDDHLIKAAESGESRVFYHKM